MAGYRVISSDSHVVEPPDLWTTRTEPEYRDRAPYVVAKEDGDWWYCEGERIIGQHNGTATGERIIGQHNGTVRAYASRRAKTLSLKNSSGKTSGPAATSPRSTSRTWTPMASTRD